MYFTKVLATQVWVSRKRELLEDTDLLRICWTAVEMFFDEFEGTKKEMRYLFVVWDAKLE